MRKIFLEEGRREVRLVVRLQMLAVVPAMLIFGHQNYAQISGNEMYSVLCQSTKVKCLGCKLLFSCGESIPNFISASNLLFSPIKYS